MAAVQINQAARDEIFSRKENIPCIRCGHGEHCLLDCDAPNEHGGSLWRRLTGGWKNAADRWISEPGNRPLWKALREEKVKRVDENVLDPRKSFNLYGRTVFEKLNSEAHQTGPIPNIFTVRPGFSYTEKGARTSNNIMVTTNYFNTRFNKEGRTVLYQYRVVGIVTPEQESEHRIPSHLRRKELMELALESSTVLSAHRNSFATDNMDLIISWTDLGPAVTTLSPGDEVDNFRIVSRRKFRNHNEETMDLKLVYQGMIPIQQFLDVTSGTITSLPITLNDATTITATHAVNILISEAASRTNAQDCQLGNKRFTKQGRIELGKKNASIGVTAYRGYYSTLKAGMSILLLNVSRTTTTFYDAIRVDDFMRRYCEKKSNSVPFSHDDKKLLENVLKGVRVNVTYQGRTKPICSLGNTPATERFFKKDPSQPSGERDVSVAQ